MASPVSTSENLTAGSVEFETMERSNVSESLLISLLEESQVEELEDERLSQVMRSLESEIDAPRAPSAAITPELGVQGSCKDHRSQDFDLEDGYDCSSGSCVSPTHDFDWFDIEMDMDMGMGMDMASSSLHDEMENWYMESGAGMVEFGELRDYSQFCYVPPMGEHACGSLWQETYD